MSDAKHTKGPWTILPLKDEKYYSTKVLIGEDEIEVWCTGSSDRDTRPSVRQVAKYWSDDYGFDHVETEECLANAMLIAAAPDILEALQAIADPTVRTDGTFAQIAIDRFRAIAKAAIDKATGGSE